MTEKEYRTHPAISRSELWKMNESAEKFKWYKEHPIEPTPALLFGQVVHKLLLQPDSFDTEFAVAPAVDRRTKAGKDEYAAFVDSVGDRTVVSRDDYDRAMDMVVAARMNPLVNKLLDGEKEVPFFWTDEDTGEDCKCRLDCLTWIDGTYYIVDYKSTTNADTETFGRRDVFNFGYHFQAAMYSEGVMHGTGLTERPKFVFIAQEKAEPYAVNVMAISDNVMLAGIDKFRELIGKYHQCKMLDVWPGYNGLGDINEVFLPKWMQNGVEGDTEE